jgi:SAM-dependent methyltransferase
LTDLERYRERYAAQYDEQSFETILVSVRRRHILGWLERHRARRVVEVGCGLEPVFAHCQEFDAWYVIEPIADFAGRARELAAGDGRVRVLDGRMEDQVARLADETFDFIIISSLLHELADPLKLLDALRSLCADETLAHFNVPNALSFHRLLAVEMGLISDVFEPSKRDQAFGHRTCFDGNKLARVLNEAGFSVVDSGSYFVKPFSHEQMDAILATGVFPPSLIDGLDRMTRHMPQHGCELYANVRKK